MGASLFVNFYCNGGKAPDEGEESSKGTKRTAPEARSKPVEESQEREESKEKEGKAVKAGAALREEANPPPYPIGEVNEPLKGAYEVEGITHSSQEPSERRVQRGYKGPLSDGYGVKGKGPKLAC